MQWPRNEDISISLSPGMRLMFLAVSVGGSCCLNLQFEVEYWSWNLKLIIFYSFAKQKKKHGDLIFMLFCTTKLYKIL